MALEVSREMGLVAEADARGDPGDRLPVEQLLACRVDPAPEDVGVRCDSEGTAEAADEMCGACTEELAGGSERYSVERVGLE